MCNRLSERLQNLIVVDTLHIIWFNKNVDAVPSGVASCIDADIEVTLQSKILLNNFEGVKQQLAGDLIRRTDINTSQHVNFVFIIHRPIPIIKIEVWKFYENLISYLFYLDYALGLIQKC